MLELRIGHDDHMALELAGEMNAVISSGEVEAALPLLNNNRSGAKQGWPSELLRYAYQEVSGDDGKVSKFHVLSRVLAAILDAAFQSGVFLDAVKSSLVTPVFKKGDKSDPANYRPIAVGEPLCRLYAVILNRRIVSWSEDNGLRAPCQAGFRPHLSTEHQLFALRHFIERSRFRKQPMFTAFVDLKKAYDSVQHPLLWASLHRIPKTEVVVFGGGCHVCTRRVAGHVQQRSQSFTYVGMLFHEDRNIKHAIQSRFSKACGAVGVHFLSLCKSGVCKLGAIAHEAATGNSAAVCVIWM